MSQSFELSIELSEPYDFNKESLVTIALNPWVKNKWPLVYFIQDEETKTGYVGESAHAYQRIKNHLDNPVRKDLKKISIIASDKFNKSVTLDIESSLIRYISAEGTYTLQNGNFGLIDHRYYQKDLYKDLFKAIWEKLHTKEIVTKTLQQVENSQLFKYSPYKSLNEDQNQSIMEILEKLCVNKSSRIFIKGAAGTGKTILATYLVKLLQTDVSDSGEDDFSEEDMKKISLVRKFKARYPAAKIGFVIAMPSLRKTLENVFRETPGLHASMIINPSETFKEAYDLLIVDEAHRLRQYKNLSWMGVFRQNNQRLGLDDSGNELDWIIANSKHQIFFYDAAQSVKPSDIEAIHFDKLLKKKNIPVIELKSQMRVLGGTDYINFVDELLHVTRKEKDQFIPDNYELLFFDSLKDLYAELTVRENQYGLSRLIAGFAWPWLSKKNETAIDIKLDGMEFQWNQERKDWVNSPNAFKEVGCIHTTQGYDLNYAGVIFGEEISYNKKTGEIEIDDKKYFDKNGKKGITKPGELKSFIINIYKTLMYRGIRGTFVYACDPGLREYLKHHIVSYSKGLRRLPKASVKPYVNAVPLYNIQAAAGSFSELQTHSSTQWVELPPDRTPKQGYFVCQVLGESMNKKIPNGAYCLFSQYEGGSRNGKIVLVQHTSIQDADFGSGYTIKQYHSEKDGASEASRHTSIILKPMSYDKSFTDIVLKEEEAIELKVIGEFVGVLG